MRFSRARTRSGCCARAATGNIAAPPRSVMNSRRFNRSNDIRPPTRQNHYDKDRELSDICQGVWEVILQPADFREVGFGSDSVKLRPSTCFPVYPNNRTLLAPTRTSG